MNINEFVSSLEGTYDNKDYCSVVGYEIDMERLYRTCQSEDIPMASRLYPVTVFMGWVVKGLLFDKKYEQKISEMIKDNDKLVMNGSNPFI